MAAQTGQVQAEILGVIVEARPASFVPAKVFLKHIVIPSLMLGYLATIFDVSTGGEQTPKVGGGHELRTTRPSTQSSKLLM
jgi:hypothetical protein